MKRTDIKLQKCV